MTYEQRAAEVERQLAEPEKAAGAKPRRRYVDRELPADLFSKTLRGELSLSEARRAARERWDDDEARGGSMNDILRRQWEAQDATPGRNIDALRERLFPARPQGDGEQAA